jgi:hypothetical protein
MRGRWAIAAAAVLALAGRSNVAASAERPVKRRAAVLPSASSRGRLTLWIEGGVGAIVPIPAGGGGGFSLAYEIAGRGHAGVFGHCTGASGGPTDAAPSERGALAQKVGLLCDVGLAAGFHGTPRPVAPDVEIGLGWGFVGLVDESKRAGHYLGTGALVMARAGARIAERYQAMFRADVPLFRAALEGAAGETFYGWSFLGEFGFRLF